MASQITGYIGQINPGNGINYSIGSTVYGECNTAAATAAKTVDMTGFTLIKGATIYVKFINANTASSPTLNVQGTGAKPIISNDTSTQYWPAGTLLELTYNDENWITNNLIAYNIAASDLSSSSTISTPLVSYNNNKLEYNEYVLYLRKPTIIDSSTSPAVLHYATGLKILGSLTGNNDNLNVSGQRGVFSINLPGPQIRFGYINDVESNQGALIYTNNNISSNGKNENSFGGSSFHFVADGEKPTKLVAGGYISIDGIKSSVTLLNLLSIEGTSTSTTGNTIISTLTTDRREEAFIRYYLPAVTTTYSGGIATTSSMQNARFYFAQRSPKSLTNTSTTASNEMPWEFYRLPITTSDLQSSLTYEILTSKIPANEEVLGGIKIGYTQTGQNYPIELDNNNLAYVNVPWTDTTYVFDSNYNASSNKAATMASITNEINKLDVSALNGAVSKTLTSIKQVNGKIDSVTYENISITKSQISDFPTSMPASDVSSWAKLPSKPSYSLSEITSTSDILAIEELTGTGFLKRTGTNDWSLDTSTYVTSSGVTSVLIQATTPVVSSVSTSQTTTLNTTISLADGYGDTKNPYGTKNRNLVLASSTNTDGVSPSFRALVAADLPDMYWANIKISNSSSTNTTPIFGSITLNDTTLTKGVNLLTLNNNEVSYYTFRAESFGPTNNKSGLIDLGSSQYKWRNLYLNGRTNYDLTNEVLTTAGLLIHPFSVQFKNLDGTKTHTTYPISVIVSSNTDNTYNSGVRLGSVNGTTILTSGESGASFASTLEIYDDEKIYLVSDSDILLYKNVANNSSSYNGPWILGGFTTTPVNAQILIADGTIGGFKTSGYTIQTSVPLNALFTDEKVKQNATTTTNNVNYKMLFTENITNGAAAQAYYNSNLIYNPSTNKLSTGNLDLSGTFNVTGTTTLSDSVIVGGPLTTNSLTVNGNSLFNNNVNFNNLPTIGNLTLLLALGLSNALHFIGKATNVITDGGNQDPGIDNYSTKSPGDVIIDKDNIYEYVYTKANTWERLGPDGNYKQIQSNSVSYSTSTTNSWISGILQNINGDITSATYSTLDTSGNWTGSAAQLTNSRKLKVALNSTTDVSFNGSADVTNIPISGTLNVSHGGTGATTFTSGYLLTGNGSNSILAYQPSWEAWTTGNTAGPKANIKLGNITYESSSIPIASDTQSGVVSTNNLIFKGTKTFYNETTTNDDDYASILFTIKDSTIPSNKTQSASSTIRVYSDHRQEGSAGTNFVLQSGGNTIIGSGEAGLTYYNKIAKTINDDSTQNNIIGKWNNTSENLYLLADTSLYLEANNNIPSGETNPINRTGVMITTGGNVIPVAQELNNPGVLSLGNTDAAWKNLYLTNSIVSTTKNLSITLNNDTTKIWIYDNTTTATYNGRNITPSLYVSGTGYFYGAVEASTNFINNVNTTGGGFYIKSQDVEYGRLYVNTLGTTTTTGVARLILGNATATGNIGNALGSIYLYSSSGTYVNILNSNTTTSVLVKIPNYNGHMVLAHVGNTNSAIGSSTIPVYVEGNGKISAGSTYAGGTLVTLNGGAAAAGSGVSFYAPTDFGTANIQALVGDGTGKAPKWVDISPSVSITDGNSSNAPKINITVLGRSGTALALTKASTTVYGVTKLSSATNSPATDIAATPAAVQAAYEAATTAAANSAYAGSISTTSVATYNTEPEVKSIKVTGNSSANTSATTGVVLQYDATLKVLNFVFA